nr:AlNc14C47G3795 [Albugo laibachii Nc14]|eukprot:CCA18255.1 AlNc14C47G3795 [Albugo laibachii Nc14]
MSLFVLDGKISKNGTRCVIITLLPWNFCDFFQRFHSRKTRGDKWTLRKYWCRSFLESEGGFRLKPLGFEAFNLAFESLISLRSRARKQSLGSYSSIRQNKTSHFLGYILAKRLYCLMEQK